MTNAAVDVAKPGQSADEAKSKKQADLEGQVAFAKSTPSSGLSTAEANARFAQYGPNELAEKKKHPLLQFLGYLWGPMPIMIWVAIIIELSKGIAIGEGWEDFAVLMVLQFANATVGYIEERNAGDAIAALKAKLAPQAHVCRDGQWKSMEARLLVPGDLIELKIGDVIPADSVLLDGKPVEVDQAALTGESLPVNKHPWEGLLMGSALKRGEAKAVVTATGGNTFFGKAAGMINAVVTQGRLQTVLFKITMALLVLSVVLCSVIFGKLMSQEIDPRAIKEGGEQGKAVQALSVVIVILVASIPIAIEVVCTSTLALGSHRLSSKGIIVARLSAIEELAGMTILCSDKTGTLTKNKLELLDPIVFMEGCEPEDVVFYAALASKRAKGNQDAIDFAMTDDKSNGYRLAKALETRGFPLEAWEEVSFEPFNPTDKRTLAVVRGPDGMMFQIAKGAPQVILKMAHNREEIRPRVSEVVQELGERGYRSLGVAINTAGEGQPERWDFVGVLSIFDPPRDDTKATVEAAMDNGIEVKMVTGDHAVIAKETCRMLGMGTNILTTDVLDDKSKTQTQTDHIILHSHGFAEVMPEHKFQIVERIRQQGHVTGMTGDGVNDAPALKRADVGIAVAGATDAARAAADLVLTEEGLSVIIDAIFESRKIFQRMRNYIIYRIACTVQLLFFFFFAALTVDPDGEYFYNKKYPTNEKGALTGLPLDTAHATEFTLPVISLVIITILNDGCMITISHDEVQPEQVPQRWAMMEMTIVAVVLGAVACISSLILLAFCMHANVLNRGTTFGILYGSAKDYITWYELRTIIYLKVSVSDFLTLFSARTRTWFWQRNVGRLLGGAACLAMGTSTILSLVWDQAFGHLPGAYMMGLRLSGGACTNVWVYCVIWWLIQDACKVGTYWLLDNKLHFDDPPPKLPNGRPKGGVKSLDGGGESGEDPVVVSNPLNPKTAAPAPAAAPAHGHGHGHGKQMQPIGEWAPTPRAAPPAPGAPAAAPVHVGAVVDNVVTAANRVLAPVVMPQKAPTSPPPVKPTAEQAALSERRVRALQLQGGASGYLANPGQAALGYPQTPGWSPLPSPAGMPMTPGSGGSTPGMGMGMMVQGPGGVPTLMAPGQGMAMVQGPNGMPMMVAQGQMMQPQMLGGGMPGTAGAAPMMMMPPGYVMAPMPMQMPGTAPAQPMQPVAGLPPQLQQAQPQAPTPTAAPEVQVGGQNMEGGEGTGQESGLPPAAPSPGTADPSGM